MHPLRQYTHRIHLYHFDKFSMKYHFLPGVQEMFSSLRLYHNLHLHSRHLLLNFHVAPARIVPVQKYSLLGVVPVSDEQKC